MSGLSIFSPQLLKFLLYLTAYHPEEFGLIPNKDNFFKVKEIFQVLIFTKKDKNIRLETLKQVFSYYFKDFFEFLEESNLVRAKEVYFSPPKVIPFKRILNNYNKLFTYFKPKLWYRLSLEGEITFKEKLPLYPEKELAENWAKVKGALVVEVNPKFLNPLVKYELFGDKILLTNTISYQACKGPQIDQKFINKYLKPKISQPKEDPHIIPFRPASEEVEEELPYRKITHGKKKEKPWKSYQKKKQKEREG